MSSIIEKVARAIYDRDDAEAETPFPWEHTSEATKAHAFNVARAAIEAMRDPSMAMIMAAHKHHEGEAWLPNSLFNSMIDAALSEPSE